MSRFGFSRRPDTVVELERPRLDEALRHDDVHAPQLSESAAALTGALPARAIADTRPRGQIERRGPQPNPEDESHRARLVQRAQDALAEETAAARGGRRG